MDGPSPPFVFAGREAFAMRDDDAIVEIRSGIRGEAELLSEIARALKFPDYFGHNWDAVDDCLGDLGWIERRLFILHADVPAVEDRILAVYLDCLGTAAVDWGQQGHELIVVFPKNAEGQIRSLLRPPFRSRQQLDR